MKLLTHYVEPLPIIGTAVTIQKTIVSYQNGKTVEALIRSGVVAFRIVGDILLVKEIWKTAVEFSFTDDAMEILTTSAVGQMDDYERLARESIGDIGETFKLSGSNIKHISKHIPYEFFNQVSIHIIILFCMRGTILFRT